MKTELIAPVALSGEDINSLTKLLLNAWSAEYALRITPLLADEEYLQSSLRWSFPQGYYSAYFSLRGILLTLGYTSMHTLSIVAASTTLHRFGLYVGTPLASTFFAELNAWRWNAETYNVLGFDPVGKQQQLVGIVDQIALAHEAHFLDVLGEAAYADLIGSMPGYITENFLWDRFNRLVANQKEEVIAA